MSLSHTHFHPVFPSLSPFFYPSGYCSFLHVLWSPRVCLFVFIGQPLYTRGGYLRKPLSELLEPNWLTPKSRITLDDPWWWEYPELRPYVSPYTTLPRTPFYLRDSFLSPIKRTYLWGYHPVRPFYSKCRPFALWSSLFSLFSPRKLSVFLAEFPLGMSYFTRVIPRYLFVSSESPWIFYPFLIAAILVFLCLVSWLLAPVIFTNGKPFLPLKSLCTIFLKLINLFLNQLQFIDIIFRRKFCSAFKNFSKWQIWDTISTFGFPFGVSWLYRYNFRLTNPIFYFPFSVCFSNPMTCLSRL